MTNRDSIKQSKRIYIILWLLCILGAWLLLPYVQHFGVVPEEVFTSKLFWLSTIQAGLFFGIVLWLNHFLVPKTDLSPCLADNPFKRIVLFV